MRRPLIQGFCQKPPWINDVDPIPLAHNMREPTWPFQAIWPMRTGRCSSRSSAVHPLFTRRPSAVGRPRKWPLRLIREAILCPAARRFAVADAVTLLLAGLECAALVLPMVRQRHGSRSIMHG